MQRFTFFIALLLLCTAPAAAQNQSFQGYIEAGDSASAKKDFYSAYRLYSIAAEDDWSGSGKYDERIGEVYYKTGVAAFRTSAFEETIRYLGMLDSIGGIMTFNDAEYYLGAAQFRTGQYSPAIASLEVWLDTAKNPDAKKMAQARDMLEDAEWALNELDKAKDLDLQMRHLPAPVNSDDSDVAYVKGPNNTRFYSSNQIEWDDDPLTPNRTISRIYKQSGTAGSELLDETINVDDKNVAHAAFTKDMKHVYYSVCDFEDFTELRCDLYRADVDAEGGWSNPKMLSINQAGSYTGQPSVGTDRNTGEMHLYFSSNRPGGVGGRDLYRATLAADGTLGTPENLRALNTEEHDVTPFFLEDRNTLFFATDGRFTFGGLDVYRAGYAGGEFRDPVNLGAAINSPADDAYYTEFTDPSQAYIASRRHVGEAKYYTPDEEVCCYDLYEFKPPTGIELNVLTLNGLTEEDLDGVTVALYQITPTGPELVEEVTNPTGNDFSFIVEPGEKYELRGTKNGFTTALDEFDLSSPELRDETSIERILRLTPAVLLDVFTFNSVDDAALPGSTIRLYEVADNGRLTLLEEVNTEAGNEANFELAIGKKYKVEAEKAGFGEAMTEVDLRDYDPNSGSRRIRRDLYLGQELEVRVIDGLTQEPLNNATVRLVKANGKVLGDETNPDGNDFYYTVSLDQPFYANTSRDGYFPRADTLRFTQQDVIDGGGRLVFYVPLYPTDPNRYLPFEVYFDNDHPNPDAYTMRTRLDYDQTYYPYVERQPVFEQRAAADMTSQEAFIARSNIEQFFEQEVVAGWDQLRYFVRALDAHMADGNAFELELAGFASPRAPTEYNRRLSARRNMSLQNYIRAYRGGVLSQFLNSGQLKVDNTALGESTAKLAQIYERIDRERESIYSVQASLERRVTLRKPLTGTSKK